VSASTGALRPQLAASSISAAVTSRMMHTHMMMKNCVEVIVRLLAELGPPHSNVVPTISDTCLSRDQQPLIKVITEGGSGFTCRRPSSSPAGHVLEKRWQLLIIEKTRPVVFVPI
jgi:hypothetical protein